MFLFFSYVCDAHPWNCHRRLRHVGLYSLCQCRPLLLWLFLPSLLYYVSGTKHIYKNTRISKVSRGGRTSKRALWEIWDIEWEEEERDSENCKVSPLAVENSGLRIEIALSLSGQVTLGKLARRTHLIWLEIVFQGIKHHQTFYNTALAGLHGRRLGGYCKVACGRHALC